MCVRSLLKQWVDYDMIYFRLLYGRVIRMQVWAGVSCEGRATELCLSHTRLYRLDYMSITASYWGIWLGVAVNWDINPWFGPSLQWGIDNQHLGALVEMYALVFLLLIGASIAGKILFYHIYDSTIALDCIGFFSLCAALFEEVFSDGDSANAILAAQAIFFIIALPPCPQKSSLSVFIV